MPSPSDKQQGFFEHSNLKDNLASSSVKGGLITLTSRGVLLILNLGTTALLARILIPEDFGLIGMVMAIVGFIDLFKDLGLSIATIQRKEITHQQVSNLFWINVGFSLCLVVITIALAPFIAWINSEPRLFDITLRLSLVYVFTGFTVQHQALLKRQMKFGLLAIVEVSAMILAVSLAIYMALDGWSYWALVAQQITWAGLSMIGSWLMCRWRPGLPKRGAGTRSMLIFGGNVTATTAINYIARNLDKVLIGVWWGAGQVGYYTKAYQFLLLPIKNINGPITTVVIPGLSRLQDDADKFRNFYLRALSLSAFFSIPLAVLLMLVAEPVILLVLGDQWLASIPIFRFLALSAIVQPILNSTGWIYVASGQTRRMVRWAMIYTAIISISFAVGLPYEAQGVALCYALAMLGITIPALRYAIHGSGIGLSDIYHSLKKIFAAALLAGTCVFMLQQTVVSTWSNIIQLIASTSLMAVIYLLILFYLFDEKSYYIGLLKYLRRSSG